VEEYQNPDNYVHWHDGRLCVDKSVGDRALAEQQATIDNLVAQMDLVRESFNLNYPGAGDPFKLRARYDELRTQAYEQQATIEDLDQKLDTLGHDYNQLRNLLEETENAKRDLRLDWQKRQDFYEDALSNLQRILSSLTWPDSLIFAEEAEARAEQAERNLEQADAQIKVVERERDEARADTERLRQELEDAVEEGLAMARLHDEARAELEAVKARRCDGCDKDDDPFGCPVGRAAHRAVRSAWPDFACNHWTAKEVKS
jgi:chromosome segregation ATPase